MYSLISYPFFRGLFCRSFFLFILFLSASACSKSSTQDTHIYGQVRTYGTEEVMDHPPVKVQLLHRRFYGYFMCWFCGHYYHVQDEVWTDSLGRYELQSLLYEDEDYFLAVDESTVHRAYRYYKPGQVDTESNRIVRFEGSYEKNYYLTAYGWVRFHILSTDPQSGDLYTFRAGSHYETFSNSVDVYRTLRLRGNQENSLARTLVRDSIYTTVEEHFFVPAFDTIDYEVRF
jgi:hypothetical protein